MIQAHRIPTWTDVDLAVTLEPDFSIIYDVTKLTVKCRLCKKKFSRDKVYNHLRYSHNSSYHQVLYKYKFWSDCNLQKWPL